MHIDRDIESQPNLVSSIKYAAPMHFHDYYEFFLIVNGKCIHRVNGGEQHLSVGALVFIRPDDIHSYDYEGNMDCSFMNVAISDAAMQDAYKYMGESFCSRELLAAKMPPYTILSPLEKDNLAGRCEKLETLATINKQQARVQTRSLIIEILSQYFSDISFNRSDSNALWLEMLLTQMQKKDNFTGGLGRMVELSGRSAGHLDRIFKQKFNVTPTGYINRIRLSYAKNLIVNTTLNIMDISMEAGFDNLSHFNHLFKRVFGITPTSLRNMSKTGLTTQSGAKQKSV